MARCAATSGLEGCAWHLEGVGNEGEDRSEDEAKAEEAKRAAEEAIANRRGVMEIAEAQAELAQAVAQLAAIKKLRQLR